MGVLRNSDETEYHGRKKGGLNNQREHGCGRLHRDRDTTVQAAMPPSIRHMTRPVGRQGAESSFESIYEANLNPTPPACPRLPPIPSGQSTICTVARKIGNGQTSPNLKLNSTEWKVTASARPKPKKTNGIAEQNRDGEKKINNKDKKDNKPGRDIRDGTMSAYAPTEVELRSSSKCACWFARLPCLRRTARTSMGGLRPSLSARSHRFFRWIPTQGYR